MMGGATTVRLALLCATIAGLGCIGGVQVKQETVPWSAVDRAEGARLFEAVCSGCHGADGKANTRVAGKLFPRPRDLTQGQYRFRTTASGTLPLREDILRTLERGLPGTAMPSWREQLDRRQLMALVLFLETLSPRLLDEDLKPEEDDVLVDPVKLKPPQPTQQLVARGKQVYARLKCSECHGETGRADGPAAPTLKNQDGTRAHAFDFTTGVFKGGATPADVYRTFMTGLDGTPMPSYADSVPDERDRWALVYYCLSLTRERGPWFYLSERPTWRDPVLHGE